MPRPRYSNSGTAQARAVDTRSAVRFYSNPLVIKKQPLLDQRRLFFEFWLPKLGWQPSKFTSKRRHKQIHVDRKRHCYDFASHCQSKPEAFQSLSNLIILCRETRYKPDYIRARSIKQEITARQAICQVARHLQKNHIGLRLSH